MNKDTVLLSMTEITEQELKVRERALLILLKEFGGEKITEQYMLVPMSGVNNR